MSNRPKTRRSGDPRKSTLIEENPMSGTTKTTIHDAMNDAAMADTVIIEPTPEPTWWDRVRAFFTPAPPKSAEQIAAEAEANEAWRENVAVTRDAVKGGQAEARASKKEVRRARAQLDRARRARLRFELGAIFRRSANRLNTEEALARRAMLDAIIKRNEEHLTNALALHETNKRALRDARITYRVARKGSPKWVAKHGTEALETYRDKIATRAYNRAKFAANVRKVLNAAGALASTLLATTGWIVVGLVTVSMALVITIAVSVKLLVVAVAVALWTMVSMLAGGIRSAVLA